MSWYHHCHKHGPKAPLTSYSAVLPLSALHAKQNHAVLLLVKLNLLLPWWLDTHLHELVHGAAAACGAGPSV